jgi:hypothetical protein
MVLGVIYFKVILPYYVNDFNNNLKNNFKNNLANETYIVASKNEVLKNCTNISSYSNEDILIDKINYTNNNIYIQI